MRRLLYSLFAACGSTLHGTLGSYLHTQLIRKPRWPWVSGLTKFRFRQGTEVRAVTSIPHNAEGNVLKASM
jgi:hypothetical protein